MALFEASKLAKLAGSALSVTGYRNQAGGFDPRSGDGARRYGGRFNPRHSFPVIYLCSSRPCVVAELSRQADRQGLAVGDLLPRELWRITVEFTKVLDLTHRATLAALSTKPIPCPEATPQNVRAKSITAPRASRSLMYGK